MDKASWQRALSNSLEINKPMIRLISHSKYCWRLPLLELKKLLDNNTSWAQDRSTADLKRMLRGSTAVVSLWDNKKLIGFGRASSDGIYRAVLWDVVVENSYQGIGYGRLIVEALVNNYYLRNAEKIYLMTTNQEGFYIQLGFTTVNSQKLMKIEKQ